jgi:hypothetical protein
MNDMSIWDYVMKIIFRGMSYESSILFIFNIIIKKTKHLAECTGLGAQLEETYGNF